MGSLDFWSILYPNWSISQDQYPLFLLNQLSFNGNDVTMRDRIQACGCQMFRGLDSGPRIAPTEASRTSFSRRTAARSSAGVKPPKPQHQAKPGRGIGKHWRNRPDDQADLACLVGDLHIVDTERSVRQHADACLDLTAAVSPRRRNSRRLFDCLDQRCSSLCVHAANPAHMRLKSRPSRAYNSPGHADRVWRNGGRSSRALPRRHRSDGSGTHRIAETERREQHLAHRTEARRPGTCAVSSPCKEGNRMSRVSKFAVIVVFHDPGIVVACP